MNSGREIPAIGFGTGTTFFNRENDVEAAIHQAYQAGFRSFDGATIYATEEGLGRGLSKLGVEREGLFITTKTPDWAWTKESIEAEVVKSMKKLQVDYIDLVLIHTPAPRKSLMEMVIVKAGLEVEAELMASLPDPMDEAAMDFARVEAWKGLQQCVSKGWVRDIGVSNFTVSHLTKLIKNPEVTIVPAVNQVEFNPYMVNSPLLDYCNKNNILLQAFAPLGTGEFSRLLDNPLLVELAKKHAKTTAQICLRWAWQLGVPTVTKTEKAARMAENLDYFDFSLSGSEMDQITGLNRDERRFGDPARFP